MVGGIVGFVVLLVFAILVALRSRKRRSLIRRLSRPGIASWTETASNISEVRVREGNEIVPEPFDRSVVTSPTVPDPLQGRVVSTMAYMESQGRSQEPPLMGETVHNMPSGRLSKDYK